MSLNKYPKNEWILWEDIHKEDYEELHGRSALVYNGWINTTIIGHKGTCIDELKEYYECDDYTPEDLKYELEGVEDFYKDFGNGDIIFDHDSLPHTGVTHIMFLEEPKLDKEK